MAGDRKNKSQIPISSNGDKCGFQVQLAVSFFSTISTCACEASVASPFQIASTTATRLPFSSFSSETITFKSSLLLISIQLFNQLGRVMLIPIPPTPHFVCVNVYTIKRFQHHFTVFL